MRAVNFYSSIVNKLDFTCGFTLLCTHNSTHLDIRAGLSKSSLGQRHTRPGTQEQDALVAPRPMSHAHSTALARARGPGTAPRGGPRAPTTRRTVTAGKASATVPAAVAASALAGGPLSLSLAAPHLPPSSSRLCSCGQRARPPASRRRYTSTSPAAAARLDSVLLPGRCTRRHADGKGNTLGARIRRAHVGARAPPDSTGQA